MDHECSKLHSHVCSNTKTYARLFANAAVEILAEKSMERTNSNSILENQVNFFFSFQIPLTFFSRRGKETRHIEHFIRIWLIHLLDLVYSSFLIQITH